MIVHIDKLIRHLRSQIESADKVDSEFVYLTKREAEGCLELAEAQDVIHEMIAEQSKLVRCADCKFGEACKNGRGEHGVMCYNSQSASHSWVHEPEWFCADGERNETE